MKRIPIPFPSVGLAALFALFPTSPVVAQQGAAPQEQAQPSTPESPYDLRGLAIDPRPNEPRFTLDTSHAIRRTAPTRAIPTQPRMIAEWEPVQGALIRYPLGISVDAVKLIASELKTYVLCSAANQSSATAVFQSTGVNLSNIEFVTTTTDTYWTRDYAPWWITDLEDGKRVVKMLDLTYRPNGVRPNDDRVPSVLATTLNLPTFFSVNFVCQGGNVMTDSLHVGASTDRVNDENPNLTLAQIQEIGLTYMGFNPYYVMVDPAYPDDYIKHIDCWAKFITPNKVLVKRLPASDSHYATFEEAANAWANQTDAEGHPYQVIRIDGSWDSPYVNHVILNDRVLVPVMTSETDPADKTALDQIQAAYGSSYRVIGVKAAPGLPWLGTDSIHCRVNSIPVFSGLIDQDMGFMFTNQPLNQTVTEGTTATFNVTVSGGTEPYTYQWYKNNAAVNGATSAIYTFTAQASDNHASIYVVLSDSASPVNTITSNNATLTVNPVPPLLITTKLASQTIPAGFPVTFKVGVSGGIPPYTYQWYKNNVAVSVATSASYTFIPQATDDNAFIYAVVSDSSNPVHTLTSNTANILVTSNNGTTYTEEEANDSISAANLVPDAVKTIVGYITTETDQDLFQVNIGAGEILKVDMVGPSGKDFDLSLLDSTGKQLKSSAGSTANENLSYQNTGTSVQSCYLQVVGYKSFSTDTPYTLALTKNFGAISIALTPVTATILTNGTQSFAATVTGSTNTAVAWTCTDGTISASGLYTAPSTAGTYTVTATSVADPTKSASVIVTVISDSSPDTTTEVTIPN